MICENKKIIHTRLQYITSKYNLSDNIRNKIEAYGAIYREYESIRMLSYKYSLEESGGIQALNLAKEKDHIDKLAQKLKIVYQKEKDLLEELIPLLQLLEIETRFSLFELYRFDIESESINFEKEMSVDYLVLCNKEKIYKGKLCVCCEEDINIDINAASLHNFWVVPINKVVKSCKYIPKDNIKTSIWALKKK